MNTMLNAEEALLEAKQRNRPRVSGTGLAERNAEDRDGAKPKPEKPKASAARTASDIERDIVQAFHDLNGAANPLRPRLCEDIAERLQGVTRRQTVADVLERKGLRIPKRGRAK